MQRVQEELEALRQRVSQGQLKAPEKIGAAASRVLSRHHGYRYYTWELKQGQFHYFEHAQNLQQEKAVEGKYLIQTEEQNLSPVEAVEIYKDLSEVERAFSGLKDVIEMRPIYHRTVSRWKRISSSPLWHSYWTGRWRKNSSPREWTSPPSKLGTR